MNNFWQKLEKPILALAPMAGITDSACREICRRYGADLTYSEMASVSALFFKPKKTLELIRFGETERPYVVQLFGKDPTHFAKATRIISSLPIRTGRTCAPRTDTCCPDGIDINFGCPAKKVFGHGSGCALMPQKELARDIIKAVCENTDLPVSIKIRAGIRGRDAINRVSTTAIEFIENTRDLPYSAVMVHGRTYEGGFSGEVDFEIISKIKEMIPEKIVLANGGINEPEDAVKILEKYPNLDGLGIARGAWGRPFIFDEIKNLLKKNVGVQFIEPGEETRFDKSNPYDFACVKKIMLEHAELIYRNKGEAGKFEMRKHLAWYVKGFPGASELRRKLVTAESLEEIKNILKSA